MFLVTRYERKPKNRMAAKYTDSVKAGIMTDLIVSSSSPSIGPRPRIVQLRYIRLIIV